MEPRHVHAKDQHRGSHSERTRLRGKTRWTDRERKGTQLEGRAIGRAMHLRPRSAHDSASIQPIRCMQCNSHTSRCCSNANIRTSGIRPRNVLVLSILNSFLGNKPTPWLWLRHVSQETQGCPYLVSPTTQLYVFPFVPIEIFHHNLAWTSHSSTRTIGRTWPFIHPTNPILHARHTPFPAPRLQIHPVRKEDTPVRSGEARSVARPRSTYTLSGPGTRAVAPGRVQIHPHPHRPRRIVARASAANAANTDPNAERRWTRRVHASPSQA